MTAFVFIDRTSEPDPGSLIALSQQAYQITQTETWDSTQGYKKKLNFINQKSVHDSSFLKGGLGKEARAQRQVLQIVESRSDRYTEKIRTVGGEW